MIIPVFLIKLLLMVFKVIKREITPPISGAKNINKIVLEIFSKSITSKRIGESI